MVDYMGQKSKKERSRRGGHRQSPVFVCPDTPHSADSARVVDDVSTNL
jgi:hypothetical protein